MRCYSIISLKFTNLKRMFSNQLICNNIIYFKIATQNRWVVEM